MGAGSAIATPIVVPPSLSPGSTYRLIFVTGGSSYVDATSTSIADYNSFVSSIAGGVSELAALGVTWTAVVSTSAVDALANVGGPTGDPIYTTNGNEVAADLSGLFSGALLNAADGDQDGLPFGGQYAWTGSHLDGTNFLGSELGASSPEYGQVGDTTGAWLEFSGVGIDPSTQLAIYGVSSELTVPTPSTSGVPEPSSVGLMAIGGMVLAVLKRMSRPGDSEPRQGKVTG